MILFEGLSGWGKPTYSRQIYPRPCRTSSPVPPTLLNSPGCGSGYDHVR